MVELDIDDIVELDDGLFGRGGGAPAGGMGE